jgi:hypothetical protein
VGEEDWELVKKTCSQDSIPPREWEERFGDGQDVTYLFTTNSKVKKHNYTRLEDLGQPIVLIQAKNTGQASKMKADDLWQLENSEFLAVLAKVMLTSNMCQQAGLCNGTTGLVMEFVYEEGESAPQLPKYVWVDVGESYTGPTFFPSCPERRGWVPIHPLTASCWTMNNATGAFDEHTRTMLPMKLCWAWTVWKAQGQTITGKVVVDLSEKECEYGLTYVAFSRATMLKNIGIVGGLTKERYCSKVKNHSKMRPR